MSRPSAEHQSSTLSLNDLSNSQTRLLSVLSHLKNATEYSGNRQHFSLGFFLDDRRQFLFMLRIAVFLQCFDRLKASRHNV
jgi:hypothetical protein